MGQIRTAKQAQMRLAMEKAWLQYYNQFLFERGLITESERNRMILKINERKTALSDK